MCHIKPPVTSKHPPISDEQFWVLTLEGLVHLRPCHDLWTGGGGTKQLLTAFPQPLHGVLPAPLGRAWGHLSVCSVCHSSRSRGTCKRSPGHWLLHPLLVLEIAGWCNAHSAGAACVPRTPREALGHDLFVEGRGQLGQLPSCGPRVWFVRSPVNWRTSQVGKVSHIDPLGSRVWSVQS